MKIHQIAFAIIATLSLACSLTAQQPQPERSSDDPTQTKQPQTALRADVKQDAIETARCKDQTFAKYLIIANQEEVAISRFARDKSTNEDVQAFATAMEKAHQACIEKLSGLAEIKATSPAATNENSPAIANNSPNIDFLQLQQEISEQCFQDSTAMLSKKEGTEFDKCFMGMQVARHAMMHSGLTVLQRHTTGEVQGFVKESLVKNAEHLRSSITLMDKLSAKAVVKTASNIK